MPSAKGLFHKAIIQSGSALKGIAQDEARKTTERILTKLAIQHNQVDQLQTIPVARLIAAIDTRGEGGPLPLAPVVDGRSLPRDPFEPMAPELSADVPMLIGSVNTEGTFFTPLESPLYSLDQAGLRSRVEARYHEAADKIIEMYRKEAPNADPSELYFRITAFPRSQVLQSERKAALGKAPVYAYLFEWETPVDGGKRHSPHTIELPFVFNNIWEQPEEVGTGPELQPLADNLTATWVAFARTGNPTIAGQPKWHPYTASERGTMIINNEWKFLNDPRRDVRVLLENLQLPGATPTYSA
jgi:para-nitrobenzyl esterase